ncbi:hypothetical protein EMIT0P218_50262 [Pseudomonas sp. IT-P218]
MLGYLSQLRGVYVNDTPKNTKPPASLETRGSVYIEFGGEGEIRINRPFRPTTALFRGFQRA